MISCKIPVGVRILGSDKPEKWQAYPCFAAKWSHARSMEVGLKVRLAIFSASSGSRNMGVPSFVAFGLQPCRLL